jgi:hypothetical protein
MMAASASPAALRVVHPVDSTSILPFAALLVGAVVIVVILLRLMHARQRAAEKLPAPTPEDGEYLDSSHIGGPIMPGADPRHSDAAARAAAALRNARGKP